MVPGTTRPPLLYTAPQCTPMSPSGRTMVLMVCLPGTKPRSLQLHSLSPAALEFFWTKRNHLSLARWLVVRFWLLLVLLWSCAAAAAADAPVLCSRWNGTQNLARNDDDSCRPRIHGWMVAKVRGRVDPSMGPGVAPVGNNAWTDRTVESVRQQVVDGIAAAAAAFGGRRRAAVRGRLILIQQIAFLGELLGDHGRVNPGRMVGQQVFVVSPFEDPALVDDADAIGVDDRRQPVRDHDDRRSAGFDEILQGRLDGLLGRLVEGRRRLVQ